MSIVTETARTRLRTWRDEDLEPFARMNADPVVMEHFVTTLTRDETAAMIERLRAHFAQHGFGPWALELPGVAEFAGFVGLIVHTFEAHFTPCVEVGWRLAPAFWGHGYATEAARASLKYGFETLGQREIVSMTVPNNLRSRAVMGRLGMTRNPADDFPHPRVADGHPLKTHVLYRLRREDFR